MQRTPLYDQHVALGGRMVDFAGWEMPVQYTSIIAEHQAVRGAVGLFDISHMGRLAIVGHKDGEAGRFLDHVLTRRASALKNGLVRYSVVCREDGGVLDDVLVYAPAQYEQWTQSLPDKDTSWQQVFRLVVNAGNTSKIVQWLNDHSGGFQIELINETPKTGMIAIQGPKGAELVDSLFGAGIVPPTYYTHGPFQGAGFAGLISRTGYTGEDGCEISVAGDRAGELWGKLVAELPKYGGAPCGLGSRDSLRMEAAMPLYGHELTENIDPFTAGVGFAANLDGRGFIGEAKLLEYSKKPNTCRRVGLRLTGKRIARQGATFFLPGGAEQIGEITSGCWSPTLEASLALGYVNHPGLDVGAAVEIDIRGKREEAVLTSLPFYRRKS